MPPGARKHQSARDLRIPHSFCVGFEGDVVAPDFDAKPRAEIFDLETQLKTARDKVAHLYARWHELELIQSALSP